MIGLRVDDAVLDALSGHADAGAPDEVCGFLVGLRGADGVEVRRVVAASNEALEPGTRYRIHARELIELEDRLRPGEEIVGVYHSHPRGPAAPSPADQEAATAWPGLLQAVVPPRPGRPRFFRPDRRSGGGLVECRVGTGALLSSAGS